MTTHKTFRVERRLNFGLEHELASRGGLQRVMTPLDWSSIPAQVRMADELGYDVLLSAEVPSDPYLPLALASQVPSKMTLGTGIAVALSRSPTSTAYTAWEMQRMSGGRFMLGLGSQVKPHIERRFAMPWSEPAKRMKEYIQVVKACWHTWQTGEPFGFEGDIYQVNLMPPSMCLPPQKNPNIPVQLAAVGEMMLRVAGEVCEGVRLHDFCSRKYVHDIAIPNLRKGFERSGRDEAAWKAFEITGGGMIATAADEDALRKEVLDLRKRLAFYASTPAYRLQLEAEGYGDQAEKLTALSKQGKWAEMLDVFTEEMAHCYAAIGTHDQIVQRIREHFDGVSTVQFSMPLQTESDKGLLRELIQDLKS
ncbi:MAG: TIGR03617 family F420-dependent LLM class oxidoreductase [Pseudoxanthomonas sp.]